MRALVLAVPLCLCAPVPLLAQCPDGTPPPCRVTPTRTARPAPPLDDRTWIVLPFENIARASDIDWLRDASVNLLYLDLSRWADIRVIDDERVADYMREVPQTRAAGPLGLQTGIAVARRAGAGKLVMGDLLKVGTRTRVIAKVFDVRTGQRLRSVQEETSNPDSLMSVFGRLARGIVNVPPPAGAGAITAGTTSLGAYQEYVAGVRALSAFDLRTARARFARALELDSAFALAHYKLSVVYGWENPGAPQRLRHAEAASRFVAGLPARERTLIGAQLAQSNNRWSEACDIYQAMVRADSTDVEAWYNVGECSFHDPLVSAVGGDSTRLAFNGNWNTALRAFRRTLDLDPTFHLAFAHIPDILQNDQRAGCRPAAGQSTCSAGGYTAAVIRRGDSLALHPVRVTNFGALSEQFAEASRTGTRRANLALARDIAAAWVQAGPDEPRAHRAFGRALLRIGDVEAAERELRRGAAADSSFDNVLYAIDRIEALIKLGRSPEAARLLDTLEGTARALRQPQTSAIVAVASASVGRFAAANQGLAAIVPPASRAFLGTVIRLLAGVPADSAEAVVRAFANGPGLQGARPADAYGALAVWGARWMRTWTGLPALDSASQDPRLRVAAFAMAGDTARLRHALRSLDSLIRGMSLETPENGFLLASAESHLLLRDTATALERLLDFERRWPHLSLTERLSGGFAFGGFLWPRTFLLLGDLAASRGDNAAAIRGYQRVVGMWSGGDPEVQPHVARARAALARLGG